MEKEKEKGKYNKIKKEQYNMYRKGLTKFKRRKLRENERKIMLIFGRSHKIILQKVRSQRGLK
jgi:hypothetical protein